MKFFIKALSVSVVVFAAITFVIMGNASSEQGTVRPADEIDYPVLLVHGLGEGPGEATFGKLEEYLEAFYFDVEVMDFNKVNNNKLKKHAAKDNIPVLAALLGKQVKSMLKQYNTEKVNIVAHSFGGLIVQAYLLDRGKEFDKKNGEFNFDVDKVLYLQTPFYGINGNEDTIAQMAEDTDYGPYTRPAQMVEDLKYGSEILFSMDSTLRSYNVYDFDVDMATIVSGADELVAPRSGSLPHFTHEFSSYKRYRIIADYPHTNHELSGAAEPVKKSLAYVDRVTQANFVAISSFLDGGRAWRRFPANLEPNGMLMVRHDSNSASASDVSLKLKKKYKAEGANGKIKPGKDIEPIFNDETNIFTFEALPPGKYEMAAKNGGKTVTEEIEFVVPKMEYSQLSYSFDPKENAFQIGDGTQGKLNGIYTLDELVYKNNNTQHRNDKVNGLDPEGFEVSLTTEGAKMATFDKGRVFIFYNNNGSSEGSWNQNGGRLEVQIRGENVKSGDLVHNGKIAMLACVDNNKNGVLEHGFGEDYEIKSSARYDWTLKHQIKVTVKYQNNTTLFSLYVDGRLVDSFDLGGRYHNPNPYISFGGRRFDVDYFAPNGLKITRFVIKNTNN